MDIVARPGPGHRLPLLHQGPGRSPPEPGRRPAPGLAANNGVAQTTALGGFVKVQPQERADAVAELRAAFGIESGADIEALEPEDRAASTPGWPTSRRRFPPATLADYIDHVDYAVNLVGIDHVGISSDFDGGGGVVGWMDTSERTERDGGARASGLHRGGDPEALGGEPPSRDARGGAGGPGTPAGEIVRPMMRPPARGAPRSSWREGCPRSGDRRGPVPAAADEGGGHPRRRPLRRHLGDASGERHHPGAGWADRGRWGRESGSPPGPGRWTCREWTVLPGFFDMHTHITSDPADGYRESQFRMFPGRRRWWGRRTPASPSRPASPRSGTPAPREHADQALKRGIEAGLIPGTPHLHGGERESASPEGTVTVGASDRTSAPRRGSRTGSSTGPTRPGPPSATRSSTGPT
jgi:hypothetical protein